MRQQAQQEDDDVQKDSEEEAPPPGAAQEQSHGEGGRLSRKGRGDEEDQGAEGGCTRRERDEG